VMPPRWCTSSADCSCPEPGGCRRPGDPHRAGRQLEEYSATQAALRLRRRVGASPHLGPARFPGLGFEGERRSGGPVQPADAFRKMLESMGRHEQERCGGSGSRCWTDPLDPGTPGGRRRATSPRCSRTPATRADLIVTFLALLELVRLRVIGAVQTERFGKSRSCSSRSREASASTRGESWMPETAKVRWMRSRIWRR